MKYAFRRLASWRVLSLLTFPVFLVAQTAAPTDPSGKAAPAGTAVAPSQRAAETGGQRAPTDPAGRTAPAGTPVAPSSLSTPNGASAPTGTTRP